MEAGISLLVYQYRRVPKDPLQVHMSPAEDIFLLENCHLFSEGDSVIPEKTVVETELGNRELFHQQHWYKISGRYDPAVRKMRSITVSCWSGGCTAGHTAETGCHRAKQYPVCRLYLKASWKRQVQPPRFGPFCRAGQREEPAFDRELQSPGAG